MRVFSAQIASGEQGGGIGYAKPEKWDAIERAIKGVGGVTQITYNNIDGTIDVGYSGTFDKIIDIEKAVQRSGTKAALINPAKVVFRPYANKDEAALISAFKGVAGVIMALKTAGGFEIYVDIAACPLSNLTDAAAGAGQPGTISSHECYEIKYTLGANADTDKLKRELLATKYVLKVEIESDQLKVLVVKGRCSKKLIRKLAESCGVLCKK